MKKMQVRVQLSDPSLLTDIHTIIHLIKISFTSSLNTFQQWEQKKIMVSLFKSEVSFFATITAICWFSAILSYLQKSEKCFFFSFPLILRIKSAVQINCNRTICFRIRVTKFKFSCKSMISQPLPIFKPLFSPKDEVGSYDNIAPNQRYIKFKKECCESC